MERGGKWAHRRPQVYQLLLSRVIDVKYGCFTFYFFLRARYRDLVFFFCFCVVSVVTFFCKFLWTYQCKAGARRGGGEAGHGVGIWHQKFAVKFPAHWQIIPVRCNQISPPRAAHFAVKYPKAGPKKGTIKISPNKTLKSLFILRCCITKDTCSCYSCNHTF